MKLPFTKMHGLGNDFVVFDFTQHPQTISPEQARFIADRNLGVGCDQILIVENTTRDDIDFKYRILNSDGSEVGQCGNGARCLALFVRDNQLTDKDTISVETVSGDMVLNIDSPHHQVTVNMGVPAFEPDRIPLRANTRRDTYSVDVEGNEIEFSALSIGNPHAVIQVEDTDNAPVEWLGQILESHALFPDRANIGFMQAIDRTRFALRVFERGVGETIACGSGACAAAIVGMQLGLLDNQVTAHLSGGDLAISWAGEGQPAMMTGPAQSVFTGEIELQQ